MEWVTLGVVVGVALWTYFNRPKVQSVSTRPSDIETPTCEDGAPIPVVFGTVCLKGPNVTWWGDVQSKKHKDNSGNVIGYLYWLSMRMRLCHGTLDGIMKILIGGKDVSTAVGIGPITGSGRTKLEANGLWSGTGWAGDLYGNIYCRMGYPNPVLGNNAGEYSEPSEVMGETSGLGPGFFGVACVELEHMLVGGNPYLQPWAFIVQRINWTNSAATWGYTAQWYPAKAYIPHGVTGETKWLRVVDSGLDEPTGDLDDWYWDNVPKGDEWDDYNAWSMPFGTGSPPSGLPAVTERTEYGWEAGKHIWAMTDVATDPTDFKLLQKIYLFVYCENAAWVWVDGTYVGTTNADNSAVNGSSESFDVTEVMQTPGKHTVVIYGLDESPADSPGSTYVYARVVTSPVVANNVDAATLYSHRDMNPAHIIRECLSDPVWGMGYPAADIDETTFTAAADTLYVERFGLSIAWDKPGSIEDFINEILRHINGTLYVDRATGKYKLTLVREGYDTGSLITLGDADVERIEDFNQRALGDIPNQVTVSYTSSMMGDPATVTITESGLVQLQGAVIGTKLDYPAITTHELASRVALRELKAVSTPSRTCTVIASRKAASLNPGEPFLLTNAEYGFSATAMRVASIELGDGRANRVRIKCIEDIFASPEDNVLAPPGNVWEDPTVIPNPIPDPIFVDTYNYKSTFYVAKIADPQVMQGVDTVLQGAQPVELPQGLVSMGWEQIRPGVWQYLTFGKLGASVGGGVSGWALTGGIEPYNGMRLLVCGNDGAEVPGEIIVYPAQDKPHTGIYVLDDCGVRWDEATMAFWGTYPVISRAPGAQRSEDFSDGCLISIGGGVPNDDRLPAYAPYARMTTTPPIVLGTTELDWEFLSSYTPVRGDNLLTEAQSLTMGDGNGAWLNLSATLAEPGTWIAFPTLEGTPNAATYPAGRTKWTVWCRFSSGDTTATTTIECQLVKYVDIDHVTVLAEAETDPIVGGNEVFPLVLTTHADVVTDQALAGGLLAVRYRLTTTSATQVVVAFQYGGTLYITRVQTPLTIGEVTGGFPHTPYGDVIALDGNGILTVPDMSLCSGEIRVSGDTFKGISILDGLGAGFVGGDKLSIRLTTNCYIHHDETVAAGAAGLNLSTSGGLTGDDADKDVGPRSQIVLQYDDLVGQWEVVGQPTVMDKT